MNLRVIFSILVVGAGVASALTTSVCAAADKPPSRLSLDGAWQFQLAPTPADAERLAGFVAEGFDTTSFKPIPVPANWTTHGFEEPHYVNGTTSEGFYLLTFNVPAAVKGRRVLLHFDGVWQSAEVWLNGTRLGRHDSGFTSFALEASRAIKPGTENRLAVRVRQQTPLFKLDANDDWALPGIYRSVWLEITPEELFLESVEVVTDFDDNYRDAELKIRAFVMRDADADFFAPSPPFAVRAILRTRAGDEVQRATFTGVINGRHNGRDVPLMLRVIAPAPWTAETPNLYDLEVELLNEGAVVHAWRERIGFREVSTAGGVLRVNGRSVKLRGVARHDQHPDVGRATREEHWRQDIELMKAANINAVRCAHYPPAEGFLRLCDELGLYVLNEIPFGFGGDRMSDPNYAEGVFLRVHETIARDRNRPSVIIWTIGNEDPFSALHLAALRAVKGLDPTRPTLLPFRAEEWLPPEVDILAPHYWDAADYDALAARSNRPIVTTEYTHALGPDDFGELQDRWDALTRHPTGAGGMIWLWADQGLRRPIRGRPVFDPLRDKSKYTREGSELVRNADAGPGEIYDAHGNNGTDGIVDADRTPQLDYWETKAVYAPVRLLVEELPFTPGQASITIPVRNEFDFLDLSTVKFAWQLFDHGTALASGATTLAAAPHVTTNLVIPTTSISTVKPHGVYYVHVTALGPDGSEITKRSVRLGRESLPPLTTAARPTKPVVKRDGDLVTVYVVDASFVFNAATGEIASINFAKQPVLTNGNPVFWRPATWCERNRLDRRERQHNWDTFMQGLPGHPRTWSVSETSTGVHLTAQREYRLDDRNAVVVDATYTVSLTGVLRVDLKYTPSVDVPWLPELGIEFSVGAGADRLVWLGEGPGISLPNRHGATVFGAWQAAFGSDHAYGTKSLLESARLAYGSGPPLEVRGASGVRLARAPAGGGHTFRILTHLQGAWTKNGPPVRPEWQLNLETTKSFEGSFELAPGR